MEKKKDVVVRQLNEFYYVVDYETTYTKRKKLLISRDPLAKDLLKKLDEYRPNKSASSEKVIESMRQKLEDKWNVGILITAAAKPFVSGLPIIKDQKRDNCLSPVKFSYDGIEIQEMEPLIITNSICGNPVTAFHTHPGAMFTECKTNELVLHVNPGILDNADEKTIKKALWNIIKKYIPKKKPVNKRIDIEEISFIYDIREETFQKYLRWYDDHLNPNGYSYRAIALCEGIRLKYPEKYEDAKTIIANTTKEVRSIKGKRTLRGVVGEAVKGEDAVENGVKIIYRAIHRKPCPSKKTKQEKYNCPTHGNECPRDCAYLASFEKDFSKRNMLFKPLNTLSPEVLEQVVDEDIHPKRKKQKKLDDY